MICIGTKKVTAYLNGKRLNLFLAEAVKPLSAPYIAQISERDNYLSITSTDTRGKFFVVFVDGVEYCVVESRVTSIYLELSEGTHTVAVKARTDGYADSAFSNFLTYVITVDDNVEGATLAFLANFSLSALNGKALSEFNSITPEEEQLTAPTISLDGDTLTMTATDERTQEFVIFVDGVEMATVAVDSVTVSTLSSMANISLSALNGKALSEFN